MADRSEDYHGYTISWQEPPPMSAGYSMSIASTDAVRQAKLEAYNGSKGAYVTRANRSLKTALGIAKAYVDGLPGF